MHALNLSIGPTGRLQALLQAAIVAAILVGLSPVAVDAQKTPANPPAEGETPKHDWAQLSSGEWVKGEVTRMFDEKLHFDSSEFDDVTIDWGDVTSLKTAGPVTLRLLDGRDVTGNFEMRNGKVKIRTGTETIEVARSDVYAITPGQGRELDWWSFSASLNFTGRSGNTEQNDLGARAEIMRQTNLTRLRLSYLGEFTTSQDNTTANSHRVPATFDVFLTHRFFLTVPALEYYTDEFKNINTQLTGGVGIGYEVYEESWVAWELGGGVAYQYTGYVSVPAGDELASNDAAIVLSTRLDFDLPRGVEWDNYYQVNVTVTNIGLTTHHLDSVLSFDIWGPLDLEVGFYFDRVEDPARTAAGVQPESNDYRYVVGFGVDF